MSKKKAFSGSTMTLKDFHGGSIPSDLSLPSAPGTVPKVPDWSERPGSGTSWGGSGSRGFSTVDRGKQSFASNGQRGVSEDKVSYLPNSANIGRNFDEDERKPLDSFSSRRSSVNDEGYYDRTRDRARTEGKFESAGVGIGHRSSNLNSNEQTGFGHQYSVPLQTKQTAIVGRPGSSGSMSGQPQFRVSRAESPAPVSSSVPNAWGIRREMDTSAVNDSVSSYSAQSVASRFAQASAVDKVSSGRWQSRVSLGLEPHSDRFSQSQELDSLYDAQKNGLDSGSAGYVDRGQARTFGNGVQNNYNERDMCGFDNYGDNRKVFSAEAGKMDAVNDDGRHVISETARPGFGELAQVRLGHNVQCGGNGDSSWHKNEGCVESYKNEFEGRNINYHSKEKTLVPSHIENTFDGSKPYYSATSSHIFGHSGDSLISEDVKNSLYSDRKLSGSVVQNFDSDASRSRFATEDVRVSSPLDGQRPGSSGSNHASATVVSESSVHLRVEERPKLKLLPRTKPLENTIDTAEVEHMENSRAGLVSKSYECHSSSSSLPVKIASEAGNITHPTVKPLGPSDIEEENRRSERPKLNLKPRSLPIEQVDRSIEKERKSVFGGARPRETVLKERGFDDVVINGLEPVPLANIGKVNKLNSKDSEQLDEKVEQGVEFSGSDNIIRVDNKVESIPFERKANNRHLERLDANRSEWKDTEKRDFRAHTEKQELQKYPRRNENWRNQQNNYRQERRLDIDKQDSWRKSADSPGSNIGLQKSASSPLLDPPTNTSGKFGRATSALELAEAFSRSASIIATGNRLSIQRSALTNSSADDAPGRKTMPFSRLTDSSVAREFSSSSSQRQINGY